MGRPTKQSIASAEERLRLVRLLKNRSQPAGQYLRLQIVLHCMEGKTLAETAALNKVTIDLGSKLQGSDVLINLADPGWCRTDLGGPNAPNAPESSIPGVVVGAFVDDKKSGRKCMLYKTW